MGNALSGASVFRGSAPVVTDLASCTKTVVQGKLAAVVCASKTTLSAPPIPNARSGACAETRSAKCQPRVMRAERIRIAVQRFIAVWQTGSAQLSNRVAVGQTPVAPQESPVEASTR